MIKYLALIAIWLYLPTESLFSGMYAVPKHRPEVNAENTVALNFSHGELFAQAVEFSSGRVERTSSNSHTSSQHTDSDICMSSWLLHLQNHISTASDYLVSNSILSAYYEFTTIAASLTNPIWVTKTSPVVEAQDKQCDGNTRVNIPTHAESFTTYVTQVTPNGEMPMWILKTSHLNLPSVTIPARKPPPEAAVSAPSCSILPDQCSVQWEQLQSQLGIYLHSSANGPFRNRMLDGLLDLEVDKILLWLRYYPDTDFFSDCAAAHVAVLSQCLQEDSKAIPELARYHSLGFRSINAGVIRSLAPSPEIALERLQDELGCDIIGQTFKVIIFSPKSQNKATTPRNICANNNYGDVLRFERNGNWSDTKKVKKEVIQWNTPITFHPVASNQGRLILLILGSYANKMPAIMELYTEHPNFDTRLVDPVYASILSGTWRFTAPSAYVAYDTIHAIYPCRWKTPMAISNSILTLAPQELSSIVPELVDCSEKPNINTDGKGFICQVQYSTRAFNPMDLQSPIPANAYFADHFFRQYRAPRFSYTEPVLLNSASPLMVERFLETFGDTLKTFHIPPMPFTIVENDEYRPMIALPNAITDVQPEFSRCRPFNWGSKLSHSPPRYYRGIYDPPIMLTPMSEMTPVVTREAVYVLGTKLGSPHPAHRYPVPDVPKQTNSPSLTDETHNQIGDQQKIASTGLPQPLVAQVGDRLETLAWIPPEHAEYIDGLYMQPGDPPTLRNGKWVSLDSNFKIIADSTEIAKLSFPPEWTSKRTKLRTPTHQRVIESTVQHAEASHQPAAQGDKSSRTAHGSSPDMNPRVVNAVSVQPSDAVDHGRSTSTADTDLTSAAQSVAGDRVRGKSTQETLSHSRAVRSFEMISVVGTLLTGALILVL
jgi:hypothetical protein